VVEVAELSSAEGNIKHSANLSAHRPYSGQIFAPYVGACGGGTREPSMGGAGLGPESGLLAEFVVPPGPALAHRALSCDRRSPRRSRPDAPPTDTLPSGHPRKDYYSNTAVVSPCLTSE
jgi:hypothetical protein